MKLAMISRYLPSGSKIGVGYQSHDIANGMAKRGHEVTMYSQYGHTEGAVYRTIAVPVGWRLRTFRFAWNLRRFDFSAYDFLHAHTDDYWLWNRKRKPAHLRTMSGSCRAEAIHSQRLWLKFRMNLLALSEALAVRVADRTICISDNTRVYFPTLKEVIPCGMDTSAFYPGNEKESAPTLLFVGTYERRKRGKLLMEIFAKEILPKIPNAQLWMVSEDAPDAPNVRRFVRIPTAELAELYRRAWVFCLPSSYEGFGVPYIEAMASGLPTVGTPNLGAREVLGNGRYGLIAEPEKLGETLRELLTDADKRKQWGDIGLERSRTFSWETVLDQYEQVYREMTA